MLQEVNFFLPHPEDPSLTVPSPRGKGIILRLAQHPMSRFVFAKHDWTPQEREQYENHNVLPRTMFSPQVPFLEEVIMLHLRFTVPASDGSDDILLPIRPDLIQKKRKSLILLCPEQSTQEPEGGTDSDAGYTGNAEKLVFLVPSPLFVTQRGKAVDRLLERQEDHDHKDFARPKDGIVDELYKLLPGGLKRYKSGDGISERSGFEVLRKLDAEEMKMYRLGTEVIMKEWLDWWDDKASKYKDRVPEDGDKW
jgi:hypothetical protein